MTDLDVRSRFGAQALRAAAELPASGERVELSAEAREVARQLSDDTVSPLVVGGVVRGLDASAVLATGLAILLGAIMPAGALHWSQIVALVAAPVLTVAFAQALDGYQVTNLRSTLSQLGRILGAWTLVFAGGCAALYALDGGNAAARGWIADWYGMAAGALVVLRLFVGVAVRRWMRDGRLVRRAVVVGGGESAAELIRSIESTQGGDIQICGIFDDRGEERSPQVVQGYPKLGTVAELVEFARVAKIGMLIVAIPLTAETRLLQILRKLWVLPVDIRLSAHANKLKFRPRSYSYIGAVPLLDVLDRPIADWDQIVKRGFDLLVATLALVALSPVLIGTALAVRLDSRGPILFRQKRYGFNNEIIDVFKFRSMYADKCDYESKVAVTKGDPRVTRVGRFIRKTSIDELPQLFNVLIGNLSLVGPRPHAVGSNTHDTLWEQVVDGYFARHKVKPGVTGWAQIHGWRGEVDSPDKLKGRVEHDLYYIENWSPLLDVAILARTPFSLLDTKNAY